LTLRYVEVCEDRSHALRRESAIKNLTRQEKLALCAGFTPEEDSHDK
jgi:predicted GIY-YIG superfamily endonuclease